MYTNPRPITAQNEEETLYIKNNKKKVFNIQLEVHCPNHSAIQRYFSFHPDAKPTSLSLK